LSWHRASSLWIPAEKDRLEAYPTVFQRAVKIAPSLPSEASRPFSNQPSAIINQQSYLPRRRYKLGTCPGCQLREYFIGVVRKELNRAIGEGECRTAGMVTPEMKRIARLAPFSTGEAIRTGGT
jgi:hypothetical protein